MITSTETIHPEQLDDGARAELSAQMNTLVGRIFDGPGVSAITTALVKGSLGNVTLERYLNERGEWVGFSALVKEELEQNGEPWTVFRAFAGLLPEYRGGQRVLRFFLTHLLRYLLLHPHRRMFFFTPIVHISSYRLVAKHASVMYPHPEHTLEQGTQALMLGLARRYGYAAVEGEHPLVCRRPMWTRGTPKAGRIGERERDAFDRFFEQINPRSSEGLCVLVLAPLTLGQIIGSAARYLRTRATLWLGALRAPRPQPVAGRVA